MGVLSAIGSAYKTVVGGTFGNAAIWAGKQGWKAGKGLYNHAGQVGEAGATMATDAAMAAASGVGAVASMAAGVGGIMGKLIDHNPAKYTNSIFGAELTSGGKALVYGTGLVAGTVGAFRDYETSQMGTPTGEVVTPTPRINYTHFGEEMGATGDLVFAMNRNRRG